MKNHSLDNLIKDLKKVTLTSEEKSGLFARLNEYADIHEPVLVTKKSPYFSYFHLSRTLSYSFVSAFALLLVITGGAVTRSEKSLPGDALYQLKVSVAEPLKVAFSPNPEARELIQVQNIEERLNEAEILAVQGKLAATTSMEIQKSIQDSVLAFDGKLSQKNQDDLDIKLSAHSIVLKSIGDRSNSDQKTHVEDIEKSVRQIGSRNSKESKNTVQVAEVQTTSLETPAPVMFAARMAAPVAPVSATTTATTTATSTVKVISTEDLERNQKIEKEVNDIDKKIERRLFRRDK